MNKTKPRPVSACFVNFTKNAETGSDFVFFLIFYDFLKGDPFKNLEMSGSRRLSGRGSVFFQDLRGFASILKERLAQIQGCTPKDRLFRAKTSRLWQGCGNVNVKKMGQGCDDEI